jgi:alkyldihydroxyacetonephosphate synthase
MEACLAVGGTISHHHGIGRAKSAWMRKEHGDAGWNLLVALKKTLDPNQILNPGALGIEW